MIQLEASRNEEEVRGVYVVFRESVNRGAIDAVEFLQVCQGQRSAESIIMRVFDPASSDIHTSTPNGHTSDNGNVR